MASEMECTQCGSSLPHPDLKGFSSCLACGHTNRVDRGDLEAEEAEAHAERAERAAARAEAAASGKAATWSTPVTAGGWEPATSRSVILTKTNAQLKTKRRGASALGCVVPIVILIGFAGALVYGLRQSGGPLDPNASTTKLYPSGGSMLVLPGEASSLDAVFVVTDNSADSARRLVRADLTSGKVAWKALPFTEGVYNAELAADGKDLFVATGDRVSVTTAATGVERWSAKVTDKVTTGCDDCFAVVGGTLVVRSDDGYLSGFTGASSEAR